MADDAQKRGDEKKLGEYTSAAEAFANRMIAFLMPATVLLLAVGFDQAVQWGRRRGGSCQLCGGGSTYGRA